MEVKLIVVGGKRAGAAIPVHGPKFFIGRADDCHLRPQSDAVSRHHCAILMEEAFVSIRDFGSRNGTLVNGERVAGERELKNGDQLKIGPLEFEVQLLVSVGGPKKPKVHNVQEAAARTVETGKVPATGDDANIAGWLEEDTTPSSTLTADTQPITSTQTTNIAVDGPHVPPAAPAQEQPPAKKEATPKKVGRFERKKQPMAENSQVAADAVLRQFFGRKR